MRRGRAALAVLVVATLLSGCGSKPRDSPSPSQPIRETGTNATIQSAKFFDCDELDVVRHANVEAPAPLRPVKDAGGLTSTVVPQAVKCAHATIVRGDNGTTNLTMPIGVFTLLEVEAIPQAVFEDTTQYFFVTGLVAKDAGLAQPFEGIHYSATVDSNLRLAFTDLPGQPEARASLHRGVQGASSSFTESTMAGLPKSGASGRLGLYSVNQTHLFAHLVEFTAYKSYLGSAVTAPEPGAGPIRENPSVDPASHALDYGVTFSFNRTVVPISTVSSP